MRVVRENVEFLYQMLWESVIDEGSSMVDVAVPRRIVLPITYDHAFYEMLRKSNIKKDARKQKLSNLFGEMRVFKTIIPKKTQKSEMLRKSNIKKDARKQKLSDLFGEMRVFKTILPRKLISLIKRRRDLMTV